MSYVDSDEFRELMVRYAHACHRVRCLSPATKVYIHRHRNAHGEESVFRYQRCDEHPIRDADSVSPYSTEVRE